MRKFIADTRAKGAPPIVLSLTVRTGSKGNGDNGQWGWGAPIGDLFDRERINILNRAWGGTSSRTFQTQGFWAKVLVDLKPGDSP